MSLKPWREVIIPHSDVLEGTFQEADFAADLTKVVRGIAQPEYQDPVRFFERTVITEGMSILLQSVARRLAGLGGDPVVQLQTAFGGGKTHTMMAVLHVAQGAVPPASMLGIQEILKRAKVKSLAQAKLAVLDGNALSPSHPRKHGKLTINTLWGELAFQLGGAEGYALVAASDQEGTSPGKDLLAQLLETYSPAVVLMDETVAYLRQFEPAKSYKGGTYNSNLSFFQALTEAASRVKRAMVVASLPESRMEVGDQLGLQALDALQKIFGRLEAVWKPVGSEESFEIVRRRLFGSVQNEAQRDQVCAAFAALYAEEPEKFPAEAREGQYQRRLQASYPIHPEVFERLYEDWSSLPKFQRTRGVLRLMARLVHSLWRSDSRDLLILPGSIPLDDVQVRNEFVANLPPGWDPIIDKDVDGPFAQPRTIDDGVPALGSLQACRRAARTIFLGSAPSVGQNVRGIGVERVRLGCAQPGQSAGKYDDALRRLADKLHYLYAGNERFWFDLRPNLRREMEDRMQRFEPELQVKDEIQVRLKSAVKSTLFSAVHVFADPKDIPDKVELRLVVLGPAARHKKKDSGSAAIQEAAAILAKHGDRPREFQNRLLFLAPDAASTSTLIDNVKQYLAWDSIVDDKDSLNLDPHHVREAEKSREAATKRVDGSLRETYRHLLAPTQDPDAEDGLREILWEDETLNTASVSFDKAVEAVAKDRDWIITGWAPIHLRDLLARWFWGESKSTVGAVRVWKDTCRYLYLPRIRSIDVFAQAVSEGLAQGEWFGFASAEKEANQFEGFIYRDTTPIHLSDSSVLIRASEAEAHASARDARKDRPTSDKPEAGGSPPESKRSGARRISSPTLQAARVPRRFHGTVSVDASDAIGDFAKVVEGVLEQLHKYGTKVRITVDIEAARADGFDPTTVSVVRENASTLKFSTAEFEDE